MPIALGAEQNELSFDPGTLDVPLRDANPELGLILDRYANAEISATPVLTDLRARIAQMIRVELEHHRPVTLAGIAGALKTTPRHVQRRPAESSTSFSALYDDVRKALAPSLLAAPAANVEQVGFELGYSEPTAFIRAFKKWYGVTPGKYRRSKP